VSASAAANLQWEQLRLRIAQTLGLAFEATRADELGQGIASLSAELGLPDARACISHLLATDWSADLQRLVAAHLTIGESYFFRDPSLMDALVREVLPEIIHRRRLAGQLRLRIWSAGCSSGEEPYSVAILLREMLPDIDRWDIALNATDLNARFLAKAAAGRFGVWSFRGVSPIRLARWFRRVDAQTWEVDASVRAMVRFDEMNLAQPDCASPRAGIEQVDLLLCRNVLMYFTREQASECASRLADALAPGGWLALSPTEVCGLHLDHLQALHVDGALLHRKPERLARSRPPSDAIFCAPVPFAPCTTPQPQVEKMTVTVDREPAASSIAPADQLAARLANEGRLDEALHWCDRWVAGNRLAPEAHYLRGLILLEMDRHLEAEEALHRCLYLEPQMSLAHVALGQIARQRGHALGARRHLSIARALLEKHERDEPLQEAGGLTAGRLRASLATPHQAGP